MGCCWSEAYETGVGAGVRKVEDEFDKVACDFCGKEDVLLVLGCGRTDRRLGAYICFECAEVALNIMAPDPK